MHFCFRLSEQGEDRQRMRLDVGVEARAVEFGANVGPRLVVLSILVSVKALMMAASLVTMRGISMAIGLLLTPGKVRRRPMRSDKKSTSDEGMIAMRRELALPFLAKF